MVFGAVDTHVVSLTGVVVRGVEPNVFVVRGHPIENSGRNLCERQARKDACQNREGTRDEKEPRVVISHNSSVSFHWSRAPLTLQGFRERAVFSEYPAPRVGCSALSR